MKKANDMMREDGYVLVSKAAELSGLSRHTIYRLMRDGTVVHTKVGQRYYVSASSLVDYLGDNPVSARLRKEVARA